MALAALIDSLDKVAEAFRGEYAPVADGPHKGKFQLSVVPVAGIALEDAESLKNALSRVREEKRQLGEKYAFLDGKKPEEIQEAIAKLNEIKNWTPDEKTKEQIESVKRQLTEKYNTEIGGLQTVVKERDRELEDLLVRSTALQAIEKNKGNSTLLLPHVLAATRVVRDEKTKRPVAIVVNADGTPRLSAKAGSQDNMTIDEFVSTMKTVDTFAPAFAGSGASGGSGTKPPAVPGNGSTAVPGTSAVQRLRMERAGAR